MLEQREKWKEVLEKLKAEVTETSYSSWFSGLLLKRIDDHTNTIYLSTDNGIAKNIIESRYIFLLESNISLVFGKKYTISLMLEKEEEEAPINNVGDNPPIFTDEYYLNPRYNFKNFVVGNNNKFAHAAAVAVAESPSDIYNPLFIYGGSGLGKTHLMHAIGHYILKNTTDKKVLYVSSEMFMNEMVTAMRMTDARGGNKMSEFRKKYRSIDVLLMDDIQFLEGKESLQEEFFNTFNELYRVNKQIIISSDRPPNKLERMDERLKSRFAWNLVADITPPDLETRVAILINRAELDNITITDDLLEVIQLIAEKITENVRELEGAFTRIITFSNLMNEEISIPFAKSVLKDIFTGEEVKITPEKIKKKVCKHFNIKIADIESSKRNRNFSFPRQIAMYLCREMTQLSLPKIGEYFGGRDHTTVLHAYDKISSELKTNDSLKEIVNTLKKEISG